MTKADYYRHKGAEYGMSHTRRDRILSLVPEGKFRVLDAACADGRLGTLIRTRGQWVAGMDISEDAVKKAEDVLDEVIRSDIEEPWPEAYQQGDIDTIILAEVLEHVFDPVQVLRSAKKALTPGGVVIITTPNFMTWTNRLKFLFGLFRYEEQGMFDFGHIRWFTEQYLKEVLHEAGFDITQERHIIFPGKLTALLRHWPSMFAWQLIVKARVR